MAFDLDYVLTNCDHRVVDNVIFYQTEIAKYLYEDATYCNDCYLGDISVGEEYYVNMPDIVQPCSLVKEWDGTFTATIPLKFKYGSSARLFFKKYWNYQRVEISENSFENYELVCRFGEKVRFGTGVAFAGPVVSFSDNGQKRWYIRINKDSEGNYVSSDIIIRRFDPTFNWIIDYTVDPIECPLCKGAGVKMDLNFNEVGKLNTVINNNKLIQQVMKAILTPKGKNVYYPEYGTLITSLLGTKNIFLGFLIRDEIMTQLERIKKFHDSMITIDSNFYTPYETLLDILGVELNLIDDPRQLSLKVLLSNNAYNKLETRYMNINF